MTRSWLPHMQGTVPAILRPWARSATWAGDSHIAQFAVAGFAALARWGWVAAEARGRLISLFYHNGKPRKTPKHTKAPAIGRGPRRTERSVSPTAVKQLG